LEVNVMHWWVGLGIDMMPPTDLCLNQG
jgi:hypothetical protein